MGAMSSSLVQDIVSSILLAAVVLLVLVGNILVVAAVATSRKLRTVTNVFIVNLACADLLLGILVLPFSAVLEIMDVWIFGQLWCQVWLAVDVWLCTTSILTLCCISLDRYLAITRPIRYPGLMSSRRAKTLVAGVWLFSFIIGCPPLMGLTEDNGNETLFGSLENTTAMPEFSLCSFQLQIDLNTTTNILDNSSCVVDTAYSPPNGPTCELTNFQGYRIYASLGSFFIPMLVMVFFYLRIYQAAVRTINSYEKGELKLKYSTRESDEGNRDITLRIHRGGRSTNSTHWTGSNTSGRGKVVTSGSPDATPEKVPNPANSRRSRNSDASLVTLKDLASEGVLGNGNTVRSQPPEDKRDSTGSLCWKKERRRYKHEEHMNPNGKYSGKQMFKSQRKPGMPLDSDDSSSSDSRTRMARISHQRAVPYSSMPLTSSASANTLDGSSNMSAKRSRCSAQKPGHTLRLHMQKFNREKKAAKTLAIIVGAFIMCWMPFFTIYLVEAFCESCVSPIIFSVTFWLGYCNSAMNPCVYALFSRDFRSAFRKLLTCKAGSKLRGFRPQNSDVPAIQLHCPVEEARSSSDIDGNWK